MREKKFRAWYNGQMIPVGSLSFFMDGEIQVNDELVGCKLMQYTGLKDKNGKEIYEGDIVRLFEHTNFDCFAEVIWNEANAKFSKTNSPTSDIFGGDEIEVIGNIYENPELLEEKK